MRLLARFLDDESGATAIEYALLGSLIMVVIVTTVQSLGVSVKALYTSIAGAFPTR